MMTLFSPMWCIVFATLPISAVVLTKIYGNKSEEERIRFLKKLSIIAMIVYVLYKGYAVISPEYETTIIAELPFNLCNILLFITLPALSKRFSFLRSYIFYVCIITTFIPIIAPDTVHFGRYIWDPICIGYFATHILGVLLIVLYVTLGIYKPVIKDIPKALLIAFVILFIVHIINVVFRYTGIYPDSNFSVTYESDNPLLQLFWKWIPIPFVYELPSIVVVIFVDFILYGVVYSCGLIKKSFKKE